jgi:putative endonuclease
MMVYVYVIQSEKDKKLYVGFTKDLKKRIALHNNGKVTSTRERRPLKLIYYEASLNQEDAIRREKYLKSSWGKRYLKSRLRNFLATMRCGLSNGAGK